MRGKGEEGKKKGKVDLTEMYYFFNAWGVI